MTADDKVVVYGNALEALTSVSGLIDGGVNGSSITLVGSFNLGDAGMNDAVLGALDELGVVVMSGLVAEEVMGDSEMFVTGLKCVGSDGAPVVVECRMLVCADTHDCNPDVFKAVNGSGLVYDGRLVVSKTFQTVDPSIYAGGTMTKFSRTLTRQLKHEAYCSVETGGYLASCVLTSVDPLSPGVVEPASPPVFTAPRSIRAKLPGGLHYAKISLPLVPSGCTSMITGGVGPGSSGRYSILRTDPRGVVSEFVYLSTSSLCARNISCLVGLHESYLNSAKASYDKGLVEDWVQWCSDDWASSLYHDRFPLLHAR